MTRNGVESLDFNMSRRLGGEVSTDRRESKHYLVVGADIRVAKRNGEYLLGAVVVEANRNLNTDNARVLVQ